MIKAVTRRVIHNFKRFTSAEKAELFLSCLGILLVAWMVLSWLEIGFNSLEPGYKYSPMNFWIRLFDLFGLSAVK